MDLLSQLLLDFSEHAAPLAHTESLEDFKQQARGVCAEVQFSPQQLHAVRDQLQALGSSGWQQFGSDGVVPTDVARWGGVGKPVMTAGSRGTHCISSRLLQDTECADAVRDCRSSRQRSCAVLLACQGTICTGACAAGGRGVTPFALLRIRSRQTRAPDTSL